MAQLNPTQFLNTTDEKPSSQIAQVRQVWSEIQVAYESGNTWKSIHARLDGNQIRMSYKNFLTYVSRIRRERGLENSNPSLQPVNESAASSDCNSPAEHLESQPSPEDRETSPIRIATPIPDIQAQEPKAQADKTIEQEDAKKSADNAVSNRPAIHLFLQQTTRVGNTVMASILAQYLTSHGHRVNCIDAGRRPTLSEYRQFEVQRLDLALDAGLAPSGLNGLIHAIPTGPGNVVVDYSALNWLRLWPHIIDQSLSLSLEKSRRRLFIHLVIAGGEAQEETIAHFQGIARYAPNQSIIVWINSHFGPVERDGKPFRDMPEYRDNASKVLGVIAMSNHSPGFGRDMETMVSNRETFDEAMMSRQTSAMTKQRIRIIQRELFDELDRLPLVGPVTEVTTNRDTRSDAVDSGKQLRIEVPAEREVEERGEPRHSEDIGDKMPAHVQELPVQQSNAPPTAAQHDAEGLLSKLRRFRITFEMDGILFCSYLLLVFALGFVTAMWLFY
jgi:hypothetical protein